jgi:predicted nucleic acid-binding protein
MKQRALITNNSREFARVTGLGLENWVQLNCNKEPTS